MIIYRHFPRIGIDPKICFLGTDAEQAAAENVEEAFSAAWSAIITDPRFMSLQIDRGEGRFLLLHHSTRTHDALQLSYFDHYGPAMHETYTDRRDPDFHEHAEPLEKLFHMFTMFCYSRPVTAEVMMGGGAL